MSVTDQIAQLEALVSLSHNQLDLDGFVSALSQKIAAGASKDIAEAQQLLGEDADKYMPVDRSYYRNQREQMRIDHERRMLELEFEAEKIRIYNLKAASLAPAQP